MARSMEANSVIWSWRSRSTSPPIRTVRQDGLRLCFRQECSTLPLAASGGNSMVNSYAPRFGRFARGAYSTLFLLLSLSCSVMGQGFGTIVGTVTDQSGAVVAGAKVTVTDPATAQSREETTNAQGYYVLPSLKPAPYDVSIAASGFGVYTQKNVVLQ